MEKIIWVQSTVGFKKVNDGLAEVNQYLEEGWKVKHITACPAGDSSMGSYAYVVLEER